MGNLPDECECMRRKKKTAKDREAEGAQEGPSGLLLNMSQLRSDYIVSPLIVHNLNHLKVKYNLYCE